MTPALMLAVLGATLVAQSKKAQPPKSARLYVFDCGSLAIPDTTPYHLKKDDVATTKMSVACFLVAHPKGTLMWDAGAVPDSLWQPGQPPPMLRYASVTKTLTSQLAEIGYKPADITYLALSHFHWDHVGNSNLFAGSTWLVRKLDYDIMFGTPPSPRTEPQNYSALKNSKTTFVTKDEYDVFGDGTVMIMSTPGHSPGHQVLFLKLKKTGPVMISGDLYHYPEERARKLIPTTEFDAKQTEASRANIEAFLTRTKAQFWIQHDFNGNAKLRKAPGFYE